MTSARSPLWPVHSRATAWFWPGTTSPWPSAMGKTGGAGRRDCPACGGARPEPVELVLRRRLEGLLGVERERAHERAHPGAAAPPPTDSTPPSRPSSTKGDAAPSRGVRRRDTAEAERGASEPVTRKQQAKTKPRGGLRAKTQVKVEATRASPSRPTPKRREAPAGDDRGAEAARPPVNSIGAAQLELDFTAPGAPSPEGSRVLACLGSAPEGLRLTDVSAALHDMSKARITRALKELMDAGRVRKSGRTRGMRYHRV